MEDGTSTSEPNGSSPQQQSNEEIHWRFSQIKGIIEEQPTDGLLKIMNDVLKVIF
jgi:hypothetical protein